MHYTYSDRDLLTREDSPVSGATTHRYNEHGELTETTDARAITVTREVDELDRVTAVRYPDASLDTTYTYDDPTVAFSLGRLTAISRHGRQVPYSYDRFGRLIQDGRLTYAYDPNGNRTAIGYPSGVSVTYGFDLADREEGLTLQVGADPPQPLASGAAYLPSGPLAGLTLGNGLAETRTHDGRYVPTGIAVPGLLDWAYATDGVGNPLEITDGLDPAGSRTYGYQDIHYFLTRGDGPWGALSWTYDKIGNRLTETRDGLTDTYAYATNLGGGHTPLLTQITLGLTSTTRDYLHGPAGHLEQVTAGANQVLFTSDEEGRLSRLARPVAGASIDFLYDGRSFLADAKSNGGRLFADGFETGDLSCWSTVSGGDPGTGPCPPQVHGERLAAVYGSKGLLYSLEAGGAFRDVFCLAGRPVAQRDSATGILTYLTTDHLGIPVLATDPAGVEVWSGGFEPFGEDFAGAEAARVFLRFPGQWEDGVWAEASSGAEVFYNVHRWYQLTIGRYARPDPLKVRPDLFPFSFVRGQPVSLVDPLGLKEILYDGCTVFFFDDGGTLVRTCAATSGLPGTSVKDVGRPYEGPIPEGKYWLRPWEFSGGWRSFFRSPSWGWWRVPLHPAPQTEALGRKNFFFHGDRKRKPGTLGCVDVGDCDTWAHDWLTETPTVSVPFFVKYAGKVCN